jgi:hypothetical protein
VLRLLPIALIVAAFAPQCGSSGGTTSPTLGTTVATTIAAQNFQTITVNAGPANEYFNGAFTTVTVCAPGTSTCQTIGGILVDTGSSGLRVLSSALTVSLPQQAAANGSPIAECAQFVDGFTWGPVQTADIKLAGETAASVPIQVVGTTPPFNNIPSACSSTGTSEETLNDLGANGIIGVGLFRQDCGDGCVTLGSNNPSFYFSCTSSSCVLTPEALLKQVSNPVWLFPADNNGVLIQLPSVPIGGAATSTGMMIFGIGTQADNQLGSAKVMTTDGNGYISTTYGARSYSQAYLDSGSNGIFYLDSNTTGLPPCRESTDFYCPTTLQSQSATMRGANGTTIPVTFSVGNVDLLNGNFTAFSEVAGPNPGGFGWGLSFFFGKTIFTGIEGQTSPGGTGPYFAF